MAAILCGGLPDLHSFFAWPWARGHARGQGCGRLPSQREPDGAAPAGDDEAVEKLNIIAIDNHCLGNNNMHHEH
jgi:hypothetical protein